MVPSGISYVFSHSLERTEVPDLLHVVPVGHHAVLDGVLERQNAALGLRLVAHERVLLHAYHCAAGGRLGAPHDRGEDRARRVVARKARL